MNKKNIIVLLIVLINQIIFAQQGWYNMNLSFGGEGIYFKDLNNGIVAGYKTTNGGLTWNYTGFGGAMSFPDPNTGYATGGGMIFKTTNFGNTWVTQYGTTILFSINFPNINTGYACGESSKVIKTTNGGTNWIIVSTPVPFNFYFTVVFFTDSSRGYIAGYSYTSDSNVFIKTTNGGINWVPQYYPRDSWGKFTSMFFINANTGFIGTTSSAHIYKTTDGGTGWNEISIPTANYIYTIHFPSATTGYASCFGGQILKTTNGGSNWFLQTTGTGSRLYSIFFINNLTGYCSGDNNTVLKTTDGGGPPIGIKPISNEIPKDFSLKQNYPNPFNPETQIEFNVPKPAYIRLTVYDVIGKNVKVLVNENLNAGKYKVSFDGGSLSSGVYFYRLDAGTFTDIKKMVLMK